MSVMDDMDLEALARGAAPFISARIKFIEERFWACCVQREERERRSQQDGRQHWPGSGETHAVTAWRTQRSKEEKVRQGWKTSQRRG